jgi:UDP-2,3-diacylglucosamine hydrolase
MKLVHAQSSPAAVFADLHLRSEDSATIKAFARTIQDTMKTVGQVFILGDLFDAWSGPETLQETAFDPLVSIFQTLQGLGVPVILLRGNRDVLLKDPEPTLPGVLVADQILWENGVRKVLLSHGDEYCLHDRPYQRLRRVLRSPIVRAIIRLIPSFLRQRLARRLRAQSVQAISTKAQDSMGLVPSAIASALAEHQAAEAWLGHLHQESHQFLEEGGSYRVLPAWVPGIPPQILQ